MAFKKAKIKQTDYTKGGRDISNTAIPLYQNSLRSMDDYLQNPSEYIDKNLEKYYSNNQTNKDFLTDYERAMANATARNYSATGGGYSSAGQRSYDDQQRYMNDRAARLHDVGVQGASNMANQWFNNNLAATGAYNTAYQQGAQYSKNDQYNDLVDQGKNNWIGNVMTAAGQGLSAIPSPWTKAIGGALAIGGNFVGTDTDSAMDAVMGSRSKGAAQSTQGGNWNLGDQFTELGKGSVGLYEKWKNGKSKKQQGK